MIVVNLWFIKHSSGLFHYGLDYAEALGDAVREIWVRDPALAAAVRRRLPGASVSIMSARGLLPRLAGARRRSDLVLTTSSHPLALGRRLVAVVHDSFPFAGRTGAVKALLFRTFLRLTGGVAGYVNHADAGHYLAAQGVPADRTRYLPNRIPEPQAGPPAGPLIVGDRLVVGLFGTDSPKKNYDALFAAAGTRPPGLPVVWRLYGHRNAYTDRLLADYPGCAIEIVGSDTLSMEQFLAGIDLAVSPAIGEGFARPVAVALLRGVPTLLLDTPVFREFYAGSARLLPTVPALVEAIAAIRPGDRIERPSLRTAADLRRAFAEAVAWLKSL